MFRFLRAKPAKRKSPKTLAPRRLTMEGLERREVFAGIVNVVVAGGTLTLNGDLSNNEVEIRQTVNVGEYFIEGKNTTQLQLGGVPFASLTIPGINGDITANLGNGDDTFSFLAPASMIPNAPASLIINNGDGSDKNFLVSTIVNNNFTVTKNVTNANSELTIDRSTINGDTVVNNTVAPASPVATLRPLSKTASWKAMDPNCGPST